MADHRWGSTLWKQLSQVSVTGKSGPNVPVDVTKDGVRIGDPEFDVTSVAKGRRPGLLRRVLARLTR